MDEMVNEALGTYFTRAKSIGYIPYGNVESLLALLYVYYLRDNYTLDEQEERIV